MCVSSNLGNFSQILFVFTFQSEVAAGVRKDGPPPNPEVPGCVYCCFFGGDISQSQRRPNLPDRHQGLTPRAEGCPLLAGCSCQPGAFFLLQRLENALFGPHDCSHAPSDGCPLIATNGNEEPSGISWTAGAAWCAIPQASTVLTSLPVGPVPVQKQEGLPTAREEEEALPDSGCLIATAVITLFNVSNIFGEGRQTGGMYWVYHTGRLPAVSWPPLSRTPEVEASSGGSGRGGHQPDGVCCPDEEVCERWQRILCALCVRRSSREG